MGLTAAVLFLFEPFGPRTLLRDQWLPDGWKPRNHAATCLAVGVRSWYHLAFTWPDVSTLRKGEFDY